MTAAIEIEGPGVGLRDSEDQEALVDRFGTLLKHVANGDGFVTRLQMLARTLPADPDAHAKDVAQRGDERAPTWLRQSYDQLQSMVSTSSEQHRAYLVACMHYTRELAAEAHTMARAARPQGGRKVDRDAGLAVVMARELTDICSRLQEADIRVRQPLGQGRLASLIHSMYDPDHPIDHIQAMTRRNAWPARTRRHGAHLPPGQDPGVVDAGTLVPRHRVGQGVAHDAGRRELPGAPPGPHPGRHPHGRRHHGPRTHRGRHRAHADREDERRGGGQPRRQDEPHRRPRDIASHSRLDQRGEDLASGAAGVNLVGYITVSARSPEALARDKRTIRASAGKSYLKLEWCDREHHRAFVNTSPSPPAFGGKDLMRDPLSVLTDAFTSFLFGKVETPAARPHLHGPGPGRLPADGRTGLGDSGVIIAARCTPGRDTSTTPSSSTVSSSPAPHWLVLGESGNGKSALEKTYVLRQLRFRDRQVVVLDAQGEDGVGEWNLIAEELGITPIRLDPTAALDHGIRLNPLDPSITTGQLALLRTIIEVAMGHGLDERSGFALKVAHAYVNETIVERQPVLMDIVEQLRHPEPESAEAMNVALDDVRAWGLDVALVLDRLVDGDLRGMFDGPTTVGIDLDAPLIVFDLSHIDRNSIAMPILMAIVGVWLEHTWIRPDRKKRIFLVEEAWHIINSPFVAQLFQRLLKFGRRLGLSFVAVVHHLSDVVDGAAAKEAAAILKMASTRTIYAQKADEARATGRVLGLPRWAVEIIPTLTPGIAVWDVNGNVQVVKHLVTESERPLVFTDRAMTESSSDRQTDDALRAAELEAEERAAAFMEQRLSDMDGSSESTVA